VEEDGNFFMLDYPVVIELGAWTPLCANDGPP